MKLIKAIADGAVIKFKHSGSVTYKIDAKKGVVMPDDHAELIQERLGSQVSVTDTDKKPTIVTPPPPADEDTEEDEDVQDDEDKGGEEDEDPKSDE